MPASQQRTHALEISLLKNLREVEISFKVDELTGILGSKGSGKSSILYALTFAFQPNELRISSNYKFSQLFTPTIHSVWIGCIFRSC